MMSVVVLSAIVACSFDALSACGYYEAIYYVVKLQSVILTTCKLK